MGSDLLPIPRFTLPAEWSPTGTMCVMVRIPQDAQYLATFVGLIDLLKWSTSFARDATNQGAATVARTWGRALIDSPIVVVECEAGMVAFRINPDTCLLEVECEGEWQPVTTPALDPRDIGDPMIPYPIPPTTFSGSCSAAHHANIAIKKAVIELSQNLIDALAFGQVLANFLSGVVSILVQIGMDFVYPQLTQLYASISVVALQQDLNVFDWQRFLLKLNCFFDDNGVITGNAYASLLDYMQDIIETKDGTGYQYPMTRSEVWKIIHFVILMAGRTGLQRAALYDKQEIVDCFCEWESIYDFHLGDGGFAATQGHWVINSGWQTTGRYLDMSVNFPEVVLLHGAAFYSQSDNPPPLSEGNGFFGSELRLDGSVVATGGADGTYQPVGSWGMPIGGGVLADSVRVFIELPVNPTGYQAIRQLAFTGRGIKPIGMP